MPSDRSQKRQAVLGTLTLLFLVVLFLGIFFLPDIRAWLTPTDRLYVQMPSAAGLRSGSAVWIAGQTAGEVKRIDVLPPSFDSTRRVTVRIEVGRRYREQIRRDSEARVTTTGLMGDAVLEISPGSATQPVIAPNDTLRFRLTGSPEAALARARSLHSSLQQLVAEARTVERDAQARSAQAKRLQTQLRTLGREFEQFTLAVQDGPLNTLSDPEFQQLVRDVGRTVGELRTAFAQAAQRARATGEAAAPTLRRLTARMDTINTAMQELQAGMTRGGGGFLVRAQTDSAIIKALHDARMQLDSVVAETRRNPLRFWF